MTDNHTTLQLIDIDIADVAARMTRGANVDVRARVLGRITGRRAPRWSWTLKPAAVLALAAVVITIQVMRTFDSVNLASAPGAVVVPRTAAALAPPTVESMNPELARRQKAASTPRLSAAEAAWLERAIPALPAIEAISIGDIQPEALSIPQLEVKPIATVPLELKPIDGSGAR